MKEQSVTNENIMPVTSFKGVQVTGITLSENGRLFANFPRWRKGVPFSVVEVTEDGNYREYPDKETNQWEIGNEPAPDKFICVQSVVAYQNKLYVLDTKSPLMKGTVAVPTVYVYDLDTNELAKAYPLERSTCKESYTNDLRVDDKKGKIYLTDSGAPGLIVLDIETGENYRILDGHKFTTAETDHLQIGEVEYRGTVHSDGIALDRKNDILYFHALCGYTLYGVPTDQLIHENVDEKNIFQMKTPAPDGMIIDEHGNLYLGDLEKSAICYLPPDRKEVKTLVDSGDISWPDTFSIYDGYLYYSNSRLHEAPEDVSDMTFTVNKIKLAELRFAQSEK